MNFNKYNFMACPHQNVWFYFYCLKVMENEGKLKESLIVCDREKEEFERKFNILEREKAEQSQTIRYDWLLL